MLNFIVGTILCFSVISKGTEKPKGPLFWRAEKDDRTINILGIAHTEISIEDIQCSEEILGYINSSVVFFTETKGRRRLDQMIIKRITDESGQSFQNLGEESQQFLRAQPIPPNLKFENMSYFGMDFILQTSCFSNHGLIRELQLLIAKRMQRVLDTEIQVIAALKGVHHVALDNKDLFGLIKEFSSKEQVAKAIKNYDRFCSRENLENFLSIVRNLMVDVVDKYKSGEAVPQNYGREIAENLKNQGVPDILIKMLVDLGDDDLTQKLFKDRNELWVSKLLLFYEVSREIFVAARYGHFTDDFNVLDMLRKEGFSIKRLNAKCEEELI